MEFGFGIFVIDDFLFFLFGYCVEVFLVLLGIESVDGRGVLLLVFLCIVGNAFIVPGVRIVCLLNVLFFFLADGIEVGLVFL